ncbi:hypothetical protein BDZ94DRAFT_1237334 [Collybia nuda]|uniref:Uncharacterized protein n=1 Tax=Collybia nuda TaxID=64659 RepID=A0A9P5Y565_9AGAR|nr:hypothetical protein BDZ94DRAFT_1237334 [Collybia nuda]
MLRYESLKLGLSKSEKVVGVGRVGRAVDGYRRGSDPASCGGLTGCICIFGVTDVFPRIPGRGDVVSEIDDDGDILLRQGRKIGALERIEEEAAVSLEEDPMALDEDAVGLTDSLMVAVLGSAVCFIVEERNFKDEYGRRKD